jgi:hypothetical protein
MPIVGVNRDKLFEAVGRKYSESHGRLQAQAGVSLQQFCCSPADYLLLQLMRSSISYASSMELSLTMW